MTPDEIESDRLDLEALAEDLEDFFRVEVAPVRPDPARPPRLPGSDYRLVRLLGDGGMGTVWEAVQLSLNRPVAVKILNVPSCEVPVWQARFVRESQIVAQLHHPNVVKVFAAGSSGGTFWYSMELVDGVPLNRYEFPDLRTAVEGIRMAAAALHYAHRCGVVHRDVKPANLLVDAQGRVLVADFGLAADVRGAPDNGGQDGTRRYMAPERLKDGTCGFAADQYALALTLREIIAKYPPSPYHVDLAHVLEKALASEPADRYVDMEAFSDDLRRVLANVPIVARPVSMFRRAVLWRRRHPVAAVATLFGLLCASGFVAALCGGYVRSETARRQAAQNARLADDALTQVFRHVSQQSPSHGDAELLSALTPYFDELVVAGGVDGEKTREALLSLGISAFRNSDYALAERSFRELVASRRNAADLNWLAETLRRQGREEESLKVSRRMVGEYSASTEESDRFQTACAYEAMANRRAPRGRNADRAAAFEIFHSLLRAHPDNHEYRYRALHLLLGDPQLARGTGMPETRADVLAELGVLADAHPDRFSYGLVIVEYATRQLKRRELGQDRASWLRNVRQRADALLGRFFSRDCVVTSVLEFRDLYAVWLDAHGLHDEALRERVRTETMIELLAGGEDLPVPVRCEHAFSGGSLPYRRLVVEGGTGEGPVSLVLLLHGRSRSGTDNVHPLSMPLLRPLVLYARRRNGRTVVLLPQCPADRPQTWFGTSRQHPDALFDAVADLAAEAAREFGVPAARVFVAGELEGADAALALAARRPELPGRVLATSMTLLPAGEASRIRAAVQVCQAEFDRWVPHDDMSRSLDAISEQAVARPRLAILSGFYRTNASLGSATDIYLCWLFDE